MIIRPKHSDVKLAVVVGFARMMDILSRWRRMDMAAVTWAQQRLQWVKAKGKAKAKAKGKAKGRERG